MGLDFDDLIRASSVSREWNDFITEKILDKDSYKSVLQDKFIETSWERGKPKVQEKSILPKNPFRNKGECHVYALTDGDYTCIVYKQRLGLSVMILLHKGQGITSSALFTGDEPMTVLELDKDTLVLRIKRRAPFYMSEFLCIPKQSLQPYSHPLLESSGARLFHMERLKSTRKILLVYISLSRDSLHTRVFGETEEREAHLQLENMDQCCVADEQGDFLILSSNTYVHQFIVVDLKHGGASHIMDFGQDPFLASPSLYGKFIVISPCSLDADQTAFRVTSHYSADLSLEQRPTIVTTSDKYLVCLDFSSQARVMMCYHHKVLKKNILSMPRVASDCHSFPIYAFMTLEKYLVVLLQVIESITNVVHKTQLCVFDLDRSNLVRVETFRPCETAWQVGDTAVALLRTRFPRSFQVDYIDFAWQP